MVARGTYSELQESRLDFSSLLRDEESQDDERQSRNPMSGAVTRCPNTLSDNSMSSMSSLASSRHSLIDRTEPLAMVGNKFEAAGRVLVACCVSLSSH